MLRGWLGFFIVTSVFAAAPAQAVPIIDKSQAAAAARTDPGTGVCGSVTHFTAGQPLANQSDAVTILNKPTTDVAVLGRAARIFDNINFRNGQPNTSGDFTLPSYRDDVFPYSQDPMATPMGTDSNFTLRLRGYFNVPATLAGKTISFGVNCDDFCSLKIGTTTVVPAANDLVSARVIKQVSFKDPGLYPLEVIYYQNGSTAYLEWSRSDTAVAECPSDICSIALSDPATYAGQFKLVQAAELYSAKTGSNPGCQECGAPGMDCSTGNYCGDGLCQVCNVPDHCGASCLACPANAYLCSAGKCVQCVADDQCPSGQTCDIPNGKCLPPQPCSRTDQCPMGQTCDLTTNLCLNPPLACTLDTQCPAGQLCDTGTGLCHTKAAMCGTDTDCKDGFACDLAAHLCKVKLTTISGCSASGVVGLGASRGPGFLASLILLLGAAALVLLRRSRRAPA